LHGPFDRYRDRDAATDLRNGWLKLGPRDDGLAQLPLAPPQNAILALSSHPTVCDESAYAALYSSYGKDDTWTALALRGFYDEPERIEKPTEMNRRWKSEHEKDLDREPRDTPLRAILGPAAEKILAALPCAGFERIRLMRLAPGGGELSRHADVTDPDAGASEGKVVRVHIPLISNERCVFQSWAWTAARAAWSCGRARPHTWTYESLMPHSIWATHLVFTSWWTATQMRLPSRCSATQRLRRSMGRPKSPEHRAALTAAARRRRDTDYSVAGCLESRCVP
jgi:hypothetical protein